MVLSDEQKANLSQEVIAKAMQCETPKQLVELALNKFQPIMLAFL